MQRLHPPGHDQPAGATLRLGHCAQPGSIADAELFLGVERAILRPDTQARKVDLAKAPPFKARTAFKDIGDRGQGHQVAMFGHDAGVLVFHLAAPLVDLDQDHEHGLQQVQRLESGYNDGFAIVAGDEIIGMCPDDH